MRDSSVQAIAVGEWQGFIEAMVADRLGWAPMRDILIPVIAVLCFAAPAGAQVTVDLHALDQLPATKPQPPRPAPRPAQRPKVTLAPVAPSTPDAPKPATDTPTAAVTTAPPPAGTPSGASPPGATPAAATLPGAAPPTAATPANPPPESAKPATASIRIPFAADQAELSAEAAAAVKGLVETAPATAAVSYNVVAYAAGTPNDPSTARRTSLARALAVRGALQTNGVPSNRINVRALGSLAGDGPPDRVDIAAVAGQAARP